MSIVNNVKIYDLEESIVASGLAMRIESNTRDMTEKDLIRAHKLSAASDNGNPAHGQFLTGIRVSFDLTFSVKAWTEMERYVFVDFVTSQSTMHRITKFNIDDLYVEQVDPRVVDIMKEKVELYNKLQKKYAEARSSNKVNEKELETMDQELKQLYLRILYTNPCGCKLTARLSTNYRCLKNIYYQRRNHRLPEWKEFTNWITTLPYFEELINTNKALN